MKNLFFAATSLVIETEDGELKYNKADFVDLRVTEDGTPFIVNDTVTTHTVVEGDACILADGRRGRTKNIHGKSMCVVENDFYADYKALTEKVVTKIATFESRDQFEALVKNLFLTTEFDAKTEQQTVTVSDLIVKEGMSPRMITRYIAETRDENLDSPSSLIEAVKSMVSVTGEDTITIPVFRRIKKESLETKISAVKENLSKPKSREDVTESRVLAVGYDAENGVDKDGYLIATESMKEVVSSVVSKPVIESMYKTSEGIDPESVTFVEEYTVKNEKGEDVTESAGEGATCYTTEGKIGKLAFVNGALVCVMTDQPTQGYTPGNGTPHSGDYNRGDVQNPPV